MAWTNYGNSGPFINNTVPPGVNATYLNNVENFLDQIVSSAVADSHITADGAGNETAVSLTLTSSGTGLTVQKNAQISGNLTVSGTETVSGAANFTAAGTGLTVAHNATISGTLTAPTYGGNPTFSGSPTVNGTLNVNSNLSLPVGSISKIAFGFVSATTGGTTVTHNMGVAPTSIICTVAGLAGVTYYITNYNHANDFTVTSSANCSMFWLAIT